MHENMELGLYPFVIEVTKHCNMKCTMCVSHADKLYQGQADSQPNFIDFEFFKDLVQQYKALKQNVGKSVLPQFQGEPLMYPKFYEACEYLESVGMDFSFTTNGSAMTEKLANRLLKLKHFKSIIFSYDGASRDVYESVRLGGKYNQVVTNITNFVNARNSNSRRDLNINLNNTELPTNKHEMDLLLHLWSDKVNSISTSNVAYKGRPTYFNFKPQERIPCGDLWHFMVVLTDGKVVPCCRDYLYEIDVGNLKEKTLEEVWLGPEYEYMRRMHLEGRWGELNLCNNCDTWMCRDQKRINQHRTSNVSTSIGAFFETFTKDFDSAPLELMNSEILSNPSYWSSSHKSGKISALENSKLKLELPKTKNLEFLRLDIPLQNVKKKENIKEYVVKGLIKSENKVCFSIAGREKVGVTDIVRTDFEGTGNIEFLIKFPLNTELDDKLTIIFYNIAPELNNAFILEDIQLICEIKNVGEDSLFVPQLIEKAVDWNWQKSIVQLNPNNKIIKTDLPNGALKFQTSTSNNSEEFKFILPDIEDAGQYALHLVIGFGNHTESPIQFFDAEGNMLFEDYILPCGKSYFEWNFTLDMNNSVFPKYFVISNKNFADAKFLIDKIWLLKHCEKKEKRKYKTFEIAAETA